jgi:hypothetical protein
MQIMSTIWRGHRPHHISIPNNGKRTVHNKDKVKVCVQIHFNICKETRVKLDKKHWFFFHLLNLLSPSIHSHP